MVPPLECLVPRVAVGHRRVKRPYLAAFVSSASVWSTSACDGSDWQSKKNRPGWSHRLCQSLLLYMQGHANFPVLRLNFDSWRKKVLSKTVGETRSNKNPRNTKANQGYSFSLHGHWWGPQVVPPLSYAPLFPEPGCQPKPPSTRVSSRSGLGRAEMRSCKP